MRDLEVQLRSPATGEVIGVWRESHDAKIDEAISAARNGLAELKSLSRWQRCDLLLATADALDARKGTVVDDLMREHGKVRIEATAEVDLTVHSLRMNAEYARRIDGAIPEVADESKRVMVSRIPLGIVGVITPWNFPVNIPVEYLGPALAMGNAVVWKGAESTPRSSRHLVEAFTEAGWPPGAVTLIEGGPSTGARLARRQELSALCFTGSNEVGDSIASIGGARRLILELGGNGPTVVFADGDLARAAAKVVAAASYCSGQSCAATERVFVDTAVYDDFIDHVLKFGQTTTVGMPDDPRSAFGPLHLSQTGAKTAAHLEEAVSRGARIVLGGTPEKKMPTDQFWPLTVLVDVHPGSLIVSEETFGPVAPISGFSGNDHLGRLLNAGQHGLNGSIFTSDLDRAFRVSEAMECGTVIVNDHSNTWETHVPFGGHPAKSSGIGRVGGQYPMLELSTVKTTVINVGGQVVSYSPPDDSPAARR